MMGFQMTTYSVGLLGFAWWLLSRRFWRPPASKHIPRTKALTVREPDEISVVSYNVLADNVVQNNPVYRYSRELHRSWEYRWNKLLEDFSNFQADIICLQEVETNRWHEWNEAMAAMGYTGVLQNRKVKRSQQHLSIANAIFYKTSRFTLCWEEHRNRVLALGLGWINTSGKEQITYVVNCHLEGHPYKPAERIAQLSSILKKIERYQGDTAENSDMVICGDFNSTRNSGPWRLLYKGRLEAGYTEAYYPDVEAVKETVAHPYALQDVYATAKAIPEFTTRAPKRRVEVDFIFCSRHLKVAAVMKAADSRGMSSIDNTLIPNARNPSDHLPLGVVLLHPKTSERQFRRRHSELGESLRDTSVIERSSVSSLSDHNQNGRYLQNNDDLYQRYSAKVINVKGKELSSKDLPSNVQALTNSCNTDGGDSDNINNHSITDNY